MNTETKSASVRLQRIKTVSRIVRYAILGLFAFSIGVSITVGFPTWRLALIEDHPVWFGLNFLPQVVLWVWYWELATLFHFYGRGLIFTTATIRCIKTLGLLCVISWLNSLALHLFYPDTMHSVVKSSYSYSLFSFSIGGISFGFLLAGIIIVIIAWIMDEGRKIQEEQELTV